jgi:hypothetical protein
VRVWDDLVSFLGLFGDDVDHSGVGDFHSALRHAWLQWLWIVLIAAEYNCALFGVNSSQS